METDELKKIAASDKQLFRKLVLERGERQISHHDGSHEMKQEFDEKIAATEQQLARIKTRLNLK